MMAKMKTEIAAEETKNDGIGLLWTGLLFDWKMDWIKVADVAMTMEVVFLQRILMLTMLAHSKNFQKLFPSFKTIINVKLGFVDKLL